MNKQVQERCRKLEHYALRISERYDNVEKVVIKILKSASGTEAGTEYEYNKDSKAYFFIPCAFSECYGSNSGFDLSNEIDSAIHACKEVSKVQKDCGGYGDIPQNYHCDNFVEAEIVISFSDMLQGL